MATFLRHEKETEKELLLETDSDKAILSDSDNRHDCYLRLWQHASGSQDHKTCGILVVSVPSLEVLVD
jgi:hypothetical protein